MAKKILSAITTLLVVLAIIFAVLLAGPRLIGVYSYTVLSGSMEPTYPTGSLIYVKKVDVSELKVGDVITFMLSQDATATHRIVEIVPDESNPDVVRFVTKGDANASADRQPVHCDNVIGTPVFMIPYLGYVATYIQHPPGTYIAISVCAILVMLMFLPDVFSKRSSDKPAQIRYEQSRQGQPNGYQRTYPQSRPYYSVPNHMYPAQTRSYQSAPAQMRSYRSTDSRVSSYQTMPTQKIRLQRQVSQRVDEEMPHGKHARNNCKMQRGC